MIKQNQTEHAVDAESSLLRNKYNMSILTVRTAIQG